jgi:hypothetical protein
MKVFSQILLFWQVLALSCFPPPATLENYLAHFLRTRAAPERRHQLIAQLYATIYAGPRRTPLSLSEIPVTVANFYQVGSRGMRTK